MNKKFVFLQEANLSKSGVAGEENLNFKNNISTTSKKAHYIQEEHKNLKNNIPLSKEELQEWIRDEDIDINALPGFLGSYIKQYLAVGKISGNITRTENLNISLQENAKFQAKINIGINSLLTSHDPAGWRTHTVGISKI